MKRLIVKTAGITLAVIVGLAVLGFGSMTLFAPGAMANLCKRTGSYRTAAWYAGLEYQKTKDIGDLREVIYLSDLLQRYDSLKEYCPQMLDHADFEAFCRAADQAEDSPYVQLGGYRTFVYSVYAEALYRTGEKESALTVAVDETAKSGYTEINPVRALISCAAEDRSFLTQLLARLETLTVPNGQDALNRDIAMLKQG